MPSATTERPWARLYGLQRWRNRATLQMKVEPLCRFCLKVGKVTPATVADHIVPHNGNEFAFWRGALQSLCSRCHNTTKAQEEGRAQQKDFINDIGVDGYPIDPKHPANKC